MGAPKLALSPPNITSGDGRPQASAALKSVKPGLSEKRRKSGTRQAHLSTDNLVRAPVQSQENGSVPGCFKCRCTF